MSLDEILANIGEPAAKDEEEVQRLDPEYVALLRALDSLLTVGQYYQPGHDRHRQVVQEAFAAVGRALGPRRSLPVEVTREGFWVDDAFLGREEREVKRLHEMLDPLNIAEIEFHKDVTAEELHAAMGVLKQQRANLSAADSYKEMTIEGLPETVKVTDRSLYVRTRGRGRGPSVGLGDPAAGGLFEIPDAMLVDSPEGQSLEREFLNIVSTIMQAGDPTKLKDAPSQEAKEALISGWIPDKTVKAIKAVLRSLEKTNSDPMMLESLIGHAHRALELTGDSDLVEMVFQRLRKEAADRGSTSKLLLENRPRPRNPKRRPIKYTMTAEQLSTVFYELEDKVDQPDDLVTPSEADCLGICVQVLAVAPTEDLLVGVGQTIYGLLSREELAPDTVRVLPHALAAATAIRDEGAVDLAVPMFCLPLRRYHPELIGRVWADAWKLLGSEEQKERAWPHVVNDILLGMQWEDPTLRFRLYEDVSSFDVEPCPGLLDRLEDLPALRDEHMSPDLFHAPAPLLYPVHRVLMNCSMAREHGQRLQERLMHQRANRLADVLIMAMGDFKVANKAVFNAILLQGMENVPHGVMCDVGGRLLRGAIARLTREERTAPWLPEAIRWLPHLDEDRARPILEKILGEKRFFIFPDWPGECRRAAREALENVEMPTIESDPGSEEPAGEDPFLALRAETADPAPGGDDPAGAGAQASPPAGGIEDDDDAPDEEPVETPR